MYTYMYSIQNLRKFLQNIVMHSHAMCVCVRLTEGSKKHTFCWGGEECVDVIGLDSLPTFHRLFLLLVQGRSAFCWGGSRAKATWGRPEVANLACGWPEKYSIHNFTELSKWKKYFKTPFWQWILWQWRISLSFNCRCKLYTYHSWWNIKSISFIFFRILFWCFVCWIMTNEAITLLLDRLTFC